MAMLLYLTQFLSKTRESEAPCFLKNEKLLIGASCVFEEKEL